MLENYLLIHKDILPDYYEKVLAVRRMLENGKEKDVSHAVKLAGISRSTYYKYKDYILEPTELDSGRKAVLSMLLDHEPGVLSTLLTRISEKGGSVLTINQNMPIHGKASVTIGLNVSEMNAGTDELVEAVASVPGVDNARLVAIE